MCHEPRESTRRHKLENFAEYVDSIRELVNPPHPIALPEWHRKLALCLDGEPSRILRERVAQAELRRHGAYFTGPKLARRLANKATPSPGTARTYHDPTCGGGDLLLAVARKLPLEPTFEDTLNAWGLHLSGRDVSPDFVRLSKARLTLLAARRSRACPPFDPLVSDDAFPDIVVGDSLTPSRSKPRVDVIVMNPPFGYVPAPADCTWASGRVNVAALFIDRAILDAPDGTEIVAILPDVLRSGSRYVAWRETTRASGCVIGETPLGLFDPWTDVDVYLFHFKKKNCPHRSCEARPPGKPTRGVGKRFAVHVGPVVPHRHAETGPRVRYIHARSLPPWRECHEVVETRQFSGAPF